MKRILVGGVAVVALCAGLWGLRTRAQLAPAAGEAVQVPAPAGAAEARVDTPTQPPTAAVTPPSAPTATAARGTPRAASYAAPPEGVPLRDVLDELRRAAEAGNAQAACRLGAEILRCRAVHSSQRNQIPPERMAAMWAQQGIDDREIDRRAADILRMHSNLAREVERCTGVDLAALPPPARWFMQAGDAGHVHSMTEALSPQQYDTRTLFRDPGLIPMYRARVQRYFQDALEAGDSAVIGPWLQAAMNADTDPLAQHLPAAWREPGLVFALQERVAAARMPPPRAGAPMLPNMFPGAEITAAQREEAGRIFARYFEHSVRPMGDGPFPPGTTTATMTASPQRFRCDEAPTG